MVSITLPPETVSKNISRLEEMKTTGRLEALSNKNCPYINSLNICKIS